MNLLLTSMAIHIGMSHLQPAASHPALGTGRACLDVDSCVLMERMKPDKSLTVLPGWAGNGVHDASWSRSITGLQPVPHVRASPPEQVHFSDTGRLHTVSPGEKPSAGDPAAAQRLLCRAKRCFQHGCFPSADANYSLLTVNEGDFAPTQKGSRTEPVTSTVTWEQKTVPPSKTFIFFFSPSTKEWGKHRCARGRGGNETANLPNLRALPLGCLLGYKAAA